MFRTLLFASGVLISGILTYPAAVLAIGSAAGQAGGAAGSGGYGDRNSSGSNGGRSDFNVNGISVHVGLTPASCNCGYYTDVNVYSSQKMTWSQMEVLGIAIANDFVDPRSYGNNVNMNHVNIEIQTPSGTFGINAWVSGSARVNDVSNNGWGQNNNVVGGN